MADHRRAVEMMDVARRVGRPADHHHAVAEFEPGERALVVGSFHPRLAAFGELEHAGEVLERGALVRVDETRVHRRRVAPRSLLRCRCSDRRHEPLLLAFEESGIAVVDRENPVGAKCRCYLFFLADADEFADTATGAVQPRAHGADGHVERGRDLVVGHSLPREEQEGVALALGQRGDRSGDVGPHPGRIEARVDVGEQVRRRRRTVFTNRAVASRRRASPVRWRASRLLAMPYSHGLASGRSVSKVSRRSKATRNNSPRSVSASSGPTRRTKYRNRVVACRSNSSPNAAGDPTEAAMTSASVRGSIPSCSPLRTDEFDPRAGSIPENQGGTGCRSC